VAEGVRGVRRHDSYTYVINLGSEYTQDELDFLRAIDRYKRIDQRPYPTWAEVLAVLVSLGWRKVEMPGPLPGRGK